MGFTAPMAVVPLTFRNSSLEGLEVWMSTPSLDAIGDMMLLGKIDVKKMTAEDVDCLRRVFAAFILSLKRWNVDVDVLDANGIPTGEKKEVPATEEGVRSLDGNFLLLVILGWVETVTGLSWNTERMANIPMQTME